MREAAEPTTGGRASAGPAWGGVSQEARAGRAGAKKGGEKRVAGGGWLGIRCPRASRLAISMLLLGALSFDIDMAYLSGAKALDGGDGFRVV